ncbi:DUF2220 family protein [Arthrobacter sp. CC3]|uniref:Wadjet anti-phage system protein JetD domain-containing protein n=1 Tax=Arthrobacter sp. CC3 TaxID=3029185 RepID=UPI0032662DB0
MPADAPGKRTGGWTTLATLRAQSLKAWDSGALLRELLDPTGAYPRRRPLKHPTAAGLRTEYAAAQAWAAELFAAAGPFTLETADVGRTTIGSNRLPAGAVFTTADDEIAFVGKTRYAAQFRELVVGLSAVDPGLRQWAWKRPLQLLAVGDAALTAGRVAVWLHENPAPGIYVRQLSLPGVHTKFLETHRRVVDEMAAALKRGVYGSDRVDGAAEPAVEPENAARIDAEPGDAVLGNASARTPAARFAARHGFVHPPELIRFRLLDPAMRLCGEARDLTLTAEAFRTLRLPVHTVVITENLVNFLALPDRPGAMALFGAGYGFSALRDADWLQHSYVLYWGDLDTHGFRILDQLRAAHPHVASVLMDRATLLEHRDAWGSEPSPVRAELARLTPDELALYQSLSDGEFGAAVRLEQELIGWDWALERLNPLGSWAP